MAEEAERARLEYLQEALLRIRGTASTSDQSVSVEVGANGALHEVRLSESGLRLDPRKLVDHIIGLHLLAHAEAGDAMRSTVEDLQAETRTVDEPEQTGDDLYGVETESGTSGVALAEPLEPAPPNEEQPRHKRPQDENSPQPQDPQPNPTPELPDRSPTTPDRTDDGSRVEAVRSEDSENLLAHTIRPYEPSDDGVYDVITPGDDNPYAAVIADSPSPRRVPLPRRMPSRSDRDDAVPQPVDPHGLDPNMLSDNQSLHLDDYLRYDFPGCDDVWHSSHWDN